MPHTVLPAEDADCPELAEILYRSQIPDGIQQYIAATYPALDTPKGRADACARFRKIRAVLKEPTHFLKVVDDITGAILGFTVCFYNPEPPKSLPGAPVRETFASEEDFEYAKDVKVKRDALLLRLMAQLQGPVTEILAFFIDNSQQRRGVGSSLMRYVQDVNKKIPAPVVLLANRTAVGFYKKQGFKVVEDALLEIPSRWHDKPPAYLVSMICEQ